MIIKSIHYPNTTTEEHICMYIVGSSCDEIKKIKKNGEMATIGWFEIIKDDQVIAEIKESVCNIYYI